jgi:hypothetical protein
VVTSSGKDLPETCSPQPLQLVAYLVLRVGGRSSTRTHGWEAGHDCDGDKVQPGTGWATGRRGRASATRCARVGSGGGGGAAAAFGAVRWMALEASDSQMDVE